MFPVPNPDAGFTRTFASGKKNTEDMSNHQPLHIEDGLDVRITTAAQSLRSRLERMLEVMEVHDGKALGEVAAVRVPLCRLSSLDFVTGIFPETKAKKYKDQLAVCKPCALRVDCLNFAVSTGQRFGVWGGKMPNQR